MKLFKKLLSVILFTGIFMESFCFTMVSKAEETDSERIVVSLGDSYSSGEGIYNFYGYDSERTYQKSKDENGNEIIIPGTKDMEDYLAHRSEGSWPGQLEIAGIGKLSENSNKNNKWYFEAVSGATTWNLGVDPSYLDLVLEMNENKLEEGLIDDNEYERIENQIEIVKTGIDPDYIDLWMKMAGFKYIDGKWQPHSRSFVSQEECDRYYKCLIEKLKDKRWRPIHQTKTLAYQYRTLTKQYKTFTMPYQLDVFNNIDCSKVEYVTMTIGGNDIGFTDIVTQATVMGIFDVNSLSNMLNNAVKKFENEVKYYLYASYFAIQDKAGEQAKILIAGYPRLFSEYPTVQLLFPFDMQTKIPKYASKFNNMIKEIVDDCRINGGLNIFFVSVEGNKYFGGHEAYTIKPYIYGIDFGANEQDLKSDVTSARSMHPNPEGAKKYAEAVQEYIDRFKENGMISGRICIDNHILFSENALKENNVKSIHAVNVDTGQTYDIAPLTSYGYFEQYIPSGTYKILVEYSSNKSNETIKKYVQYGGKFDAEFSIENGEIIKNINLYVADENPMYNVDDTELTNDTEKNLDNESVTIYQDVLLEYIDKYGISSITQDGSVELKGAYFRLIDFDNDGTQELIISYEDESCSNRVTVYGVRDSKPVCLLNPPLYYLPSHMDIQTAIVTDDNTSKKYLVQKEYYCEDKSGYTWTYYTFNSGNCEVKYKTYTPDDGKKNNDLETKGYRFSDLEKVRLKFGEQGLGKTRPYDMISAPGVLFSFVTIEDAEHYYINSYNAINSILNSETAFNEIYEKKKSGLIDVSESSSASISSAKIIGEYSDGGSGYMFRLDVSGNFSDFKVDVTEGDFCYGITTKTITHEELEANSSYISGGSTIESLSAVITPYDSNGVPGKSFTVAWNENDIELKSPTENMLMGEFQVSLLTGNNIVLYSKADVNSKVLSYLPNDNSFNLYHSYRGKDWYILCYQGKWGYIFTNYDEIEILEVQHGW